MAANSKRAGGDGEVIAAVDLGSNSFHIVVARAHHGQLAVVDRLRETVRLASGLNENGELDSATRDRALACLRRFGQRLREMRADQVRVVGTSALRRTRDADQFLSDAAQALGGHSVEVISGVEEARLTYIGVSHHSPGGPGSTLVVDVGGGSTELIIGRGHEPVRLESLGVGCVGVMDRFFADGRFDRARFQRARMAARLELQPVAAAFRRDGWARAVGSSGSVRAAAAVARQLALTDGPLTRAALEALAERLIDTGRVELSELPGLGADRAPVFAGGVVILAEVLASLGIERLEVGDGALREGLLHDMLGRLYDEDARERTVRAMQRRYHVDEEQAERVEETARALLAQVARDYGLEDRRFRQLVQWAARLHEVGLDIAHSKYHQHGGYLLAHADMPGFGRLEQQLLATLVTCHRRKLDGSALEKLPAPWREPMLGLIVVLRLAVLLNRARGPLQLPRLGAVAGERSLRLDVPQGWLADNPLTEADLDQEREWLRAGGFTLEVGAYSPAQDASASSASSEVCADTAGSPALGRSSS